MPELPAGPRTTIPQTIKNQAQDLQSLDVPPHMSVQALRFRYPSIHRSESRDKMFCATVLYPNQEGSTFDFDHYAKTLAPMYAEFLGANCERYEVRKGLMAPGAPRAGFAIIASYWVRSDTEYQDSLSDPRFPEIMTRFAAFSDVEPIRQFDEVVSGDG